MRFLALVMLLASSATAHAGSYTKTRYPIVLAHGMAGFDELFGVVDYFNGIPKELRRGGANVYLTQVSAFASTEMRGEQLLEQVEYIVAATGKGKVHLIGHSHGGLDARYVAAVRPDLVASVTTIGTPHHGAALATFLRGHMSSGGFSEDVLSLFADALGTVLGLLSGSMNPQDSVAALDSLTTDALAEFNARYPEGAPSQDCANGPTVVNGVRYYSFAGDSAVTNVLDVSDYALGIAALVADDDNDGLVGRCSAHWGEVIRDDYSWNHLDEVNQLFGLAGLFTASPTSVLRSHANRLKGLGL